MKLEDRLIKEKQDIRNKADEMRVQLELEETKENREKPYVSMSSQRLA